MQLFLTTIHARNFLDDDLDQQERLDARIAKLIRELIEIKATNRRFGAHQKTIRDSRGFGPQFPVSYRPTNRA